MNARDLIAALDDADRHTRDEAFDRVAASRDVSLLDPLRAKAENDARAETLLCRYLRNLPPATSGPHLLTLLRSPNAQTRSHALSAVEALPDDDQIHLLTETVRDAPEDLIEGILQRFAVLRRPSLVPTIVPYTTHASESVAAAACDALAKIDSARAIRPLLDLVETPGSPLRVRAIAAVTGTTGFKKFRRLFPLLRDPDPEVRAAAVRALGGWTGRGTSNALIDALASESDENVAKLLLNTLGKRAEAEAAKAVIQTAAAHENPQIRRAASWILEEVPDALFERESGRLLKQADESIQAYVLVKLGHRQVAGAGPMMTGFVTPETPPRLRLAAIQGLGMLGDPGFLAHVKPLVESSDPMEAYAATLAASQMAHRLEDSPALKRLLTSPDEGRVVLKQVVLQYLIDAVTLNPDDASLVDAILGNLESLNTNIRYLSVRLAGRVGSRKTLVPLLNIYREASDQDLTSAAVAAVDDILDGDTAALLKDLEVSDPALLGQLRTNHDSAGFWIENLDRLADPEPEVLRRLASRLYEAAPDTVSAFLRSRTIETEWDVALAAEWLETLDLQTLEGRADWKSLFDCGHREIVDAAQLRVREAGATWAVHSLMPAVGSAPDEALDTELRRSVKLLLGF